MCGCVAADVRGGRRSRAELTDTRPDEAADFMSLMSVETTAKVLIAMPIAAAAKALAQMTPLHAARLVRTARPALGRFAPLRDGLQPPLMA
jgi:hypothetical protein